MGESMQRTTGGQLLECEKLLGDALAGFAAEFRMIDVVNLIADIHHERHGNLEDLVNSAAELFFKSDVLSFSKVGHVEIGWGSAATISIWMEFIHASVCARFQLQIGTDHAGVHLDYLKTGEMDKKPGCQVTQLAAAIAEASLLEPSDSIRRYQLSVLARELAGSEAF